ncbi:hypothetical protein AAHE18_15G161000 [Arachis hypogaea]
MAEVFELWSCFLLTDTFAFAFLCNSPITFESPPDSISVANFTSNKTCKTPFSDN